MLELSKRQLDEFRELLLDTQAELSELLEDSVESASVVTLDQSKVGRLSRMDAIQQQQVASSSRSGYQTRLKKVGQALDLLKRGDYGYCVECGEPIHPQRLRARPESVRCVDCKMASEG